eukprot:4310447-Heterocapsa_arctica.AAC.1
MGGILKLMGSAQANVAESKRSAVVEAKLAKVRERLFEAVGRRAKGKQPAERTICNAELVEAYSSRADDPDKEFAKWLYEGCPA